MDTATETWRLEELVKQSQQLLDILPEGDSKRVRWLPNERLVRYYTTLGLIARPAIMRGRVAYYTHQHLLQILAIKTLQAQGQSLQEVQLRLTALTEDQLEKIVGLPPDWKGRLSPSKESPAEPPPPPPGRFWERAPAQTGPTSLTEGAPAKAATAQLPDGAPAKTAPAQLPDGAPAKTAPAQLPDGAPAKAAPAPLTERAAPAPLIDAAPGQTAPAQMPAGTPAPVTQETFALVGLELMPGVQLLVDRQRFPHLDPGSLRRAARSLCDYLEQNEERVDHQTERTQP